MVSWRASLLVPILAAGLAASCAHSSAEDDSTPLPPRGEAGADGEGGASDGGPTFDGATADGSTAPCDPQKPFGTPTAITELNTADIDILSSISADELTIYLGTNHGVAGFHQFYATRASTAAPFGALQLLFPTGAFDDWAVTVTPDNLTAILSSDRNGTSSDLYVATRSSPLAAFGALSTVAGLNTAANEEGPRWSADGKTLYFDSTRSGGVRHIFRAAVTGASFGAAQPITELQSSALDAVPVLTPDELTIYFLSERAPTTDGDIYVATRAVKTDPFSNIHAVANVNSPSLDAPGGVSADGCTLYFSSGRAGNTDIFVARKPR